MFKRISVNGKDLWINTDRIKFMKYATENSQMLEIYFQDNDLNLSVFDPIGTLADYIANTCKTLRPDPRPKSPPDYV